MKKPNWLTHITDIPQAAKRNRTSLYTIALEGWRRGLVLTFHNHIAEDGSRFLYSLASDKRTHYFNESCGDKVNEEAVRICEDKYLTQEYLRNANVPTPLTKRYSNEQSKNEILEDVKEMQYPLVVKPIDGSAGKGVITHIKTLDELSKAIDETRIKYEGEILIQEHVYGDEVRIYVLKDKVIAAAKREPANVIGDGLKTVMELINEKNELRKQTPHLYYRPIVVNKAIHDRLKELGYTVDTILPDDKRVYLKTISNISAGGDPVDVTDLLTDRQKEIAVSANEAIPGLEHSGIDMIINETDGTGSILEVNTRPGIGSHLFPIEGNAIDVPKHIIDYYFPETKANKVDSFVNKYYFDIQTVFDSLNQGYLQRLEIKSCPSKVQYSKNILLNTKMETMDVYNLLEKSIINGQFHGHIKKSSSEQLEILLINSDESTLNRLIKYIEERKQNFLANTINTIDYDGNVKVGFEVIDGITSMSELAIRNEIRENKNKVQQKKKENIRLTKEINKIRNSKSWKISKVIRVK